MESSKTANKTRVLSIFKKIFFVLLSSFVYAIGIKLIVQQNKFLSGGVSGLTVIVSRYLSMQIGKEELEAVLYSAFYILFNIPIFIFGMKKVGKQFIFYSILNVFLFSIFVSLIPVRWYNNFQLNSIDMLTSAVLAGLLTGIGASLALVNGFSLGGTDIIAMYLSRTKGKGIGSYNMAMNIVILLLGGLIFQNYASLIYTIIYFFISSLVVNNLYIGNKKVLIEIVTSKADELIEILMQKSHHGCTVLDAIGAYSKENKKVLRIVVSLNQSRAVCEIVKEIDKNSFTTLVNVHQINGKFYIPPIK